MTKTVTSKDGTKLGYSVLGHGPGLLLIQGTMGTAFNFKELSEALADTFTVYVPDRRDRGMSGQGRSDYGVQREVEDLDALLHRTGAHYVFGLSSGAIVALQAACSLSTIHKLAIYEPPLLTKEGLPTHYLERYTKQMAEGNIAGALVTGMKAGQFAPPIMNIVPDWLLAKMVGLILRQEKKKGAGGYPLMEEMAYTLGNDFALIKEMAGKTSDFKAVRPDVLVLGGSKSQAYLKDALDRLEKVLPNATRIELPGLDHGAAWNYDKRRNQRGDPKRVAAELRRFFNQ